MWLAVGWVPRKDPKGLTCFPHLEDSRFLPRLGPMPKKKSVVPEILRAAMRDELQKVVSFPTEVIQNEDVPIVDRLAAYELLAKYGIGQQRELKGEIQHSHGVIHLPPLATGQPQLGSGELTVEADEIEVVE